MIDVGQTHRTTHDDHKHPPPNIRIHPLFPCQLHQLVLPVCLDLTQLFLLSHARVCRVRLGVDKRIAGPGGTDEPPFAFGRGGEEIGEGDAEGVVCEDWTR
jgi:hypothetical protein